MAKGVISKKRKTPSVHSRALRRATSPSIDTDKSLKNVKPPTESVDHRPSVLAIHQGAGVSKKTTKSRNMSSKARRRYEKVQDRAANIMERTERKIAKSKGQARTIQTRSKAWDEINNQIPANKSKSQGEVVNGEDEASELDEEMDDAQLDKARDGATSADKVPLHEVEEEDEIL
ncbi:Alb1-domain-containing protein [Daldinia decipiens]|uniref:Alb1-domain-containing protein n=1 Tax=Daldinia decipiens TaxID=326647 RepID=UPI0020C53B56|nr:Alb1-domain-containing protein [Daldinia decipiens]KAI1663085.1 Alb1-domain-containing protein [Daldinia decipiens]